MKRIDEIKQEIEAFNKETGFDIGIQVYAYPVNVYTISAGLPTKTAEYLRP